MTGGRHYDSLGIRGVAHKGKERCGRYRSTNSLKAKYWLLKTATYTGTMQESRLEQIGTQEQQEQQLQQDTEPDSRIHSWTTGYAAGLQDTQPDSRIHGWTTGYTAGQQDTDTPQQQPPCNGRDESHTNRSRTGAKTPLWVVF